MKMIISITPSDFAAWGDEARKTMEIIRSNGKDGDFNAMVEDMFTFNVSEDAFNEWLTNARPQILGALGIKEK